MVFLVERFLIVHSCFDPEDISFRSYRDTWTNCNLSLKRVAIGVPADLPGRSRTQPVAEAAENLRITARRRWIRLHFQRQIRPSARWPSPALLQTALAKDHLPQLGKPHRRSYRRMGPNPSHHV